MRTQLPPRLLVVRLGDLLHLDRVVDHEVHELVETLWNTVSIFCFARIWGVREEEGTNPDLPLDPDGELLV